MISGPYSIASRQSVEKFGGALPAGTPDLHILGALDNGDIRLNEYRYDAKAGLLGRYSTLLMLHPGP